MPKQLVGQVLGSPEPERKAGILFLINKSLQYRVLKERHDDRGRIVKVTIAIGDRKISITNIYAPNQ